MKKLHFALIALSVFILSGCGGGGGSSSSDPIKQKQISPGIKQVIVLSSPALERNKRYMLYKGASLSGMNGSKYYVSYTGSEAVQSTLNLGFIEEISADESFIIVNYAPEYESHSGSVVFAYDPSGITENFAPAGDISFTGGRLMYYSALDLPGSQDVSVLSASVRPVDAEIYAEHESDRGITTFAMGRGTSLSFIAVDEQRYTSRDIMPAGNIFRLVRKVNTFSGIVSGY